MEVIFLYIPNEMYFFLFKTFFFYFLIFSSPRDFILVDLISLIFFKFFCAIFQILLMIRKMFESLPTLVDIEVSVGHKFTVCGDIHGQFYDLCNIFELNGLPSEENPYVSLHFFN